jgi:hypothetical protein
MESIEAVQPANALDHEERDRAFSARLRELIKAHTGRDDHFVMLYWQPMRHGHRYVASCDPRELKALATWIYTDLAPELEAKMRIGGVMLVPDGTVR